MIIGNDKIILWLLLLFIYENSCSLNGVWNKAFPCVPFYS